ncbi:MAG: hypothetical protein JWQ87_4473 [Candidatus Sulfotelmatobacter sp.]|nr:hypothetical protein [Candidatus Sulfotelmatobacter sp.]
MEGFGAPAWGGFLALNFFPVSCGTAGAEVDNLLLRRNFADDHFVDVAPDPLFSRLDGAHYRMRAGVKVFGGVLVLRRVAATDVAADHAQAEVDPAVAHFYALFADAGSGGLDLNVIEMLAFF